VSYLKENPPRPMGFSPVRREDVGSEEAWRSLFADGDVAAGRSVPLDGNQRFKPMYRMLLTERVPFDWQGPKQSAPPPTEEEEARSRELEAARQTELKRVDIRRAKQKALVEELKAKQENPAS
jgi:hypothetical protein